MHDYMEDGKNWVQLDYRSFVGDARDVDYSIIKPTKTTPKTVMKDIL